MGTGVNYTGKKVIVGLTGRIASGVTAFLLKKQGLQVIGVSIITTVGDDYADDSLAPKCHINDLDQIKRFCDQLGIPFYATDGKSEFSASVLDPFVSNKLTAQANATCFNCTNLRIKILYEKMKKLKADFISTGHFCKVHKSLTSDFYSIHSNNDIDSDQSFLMAGLDDKYLKHLILPLGDLRVVEVETIAKKFNLSLAPSRSSRDFCFTENESNEKIIKNRIPKFFLRDGQVLNVDTEHYHGEHKGVIYHYITEKGLHFAGISPNDPNLQVVGYDFDKALLEIGSPENLEFKGCQLVELAFSSGLDRSRPMNCFFKYKYSRDYVPCQLFFKNNRSAYVEFSQKIYPLIPGEKIVLFDRDSRNAKVIGQGVIGERGEFDLIDRAGEFKVKNEENIEETKVELFKF